MKKERLLPAIDKLADIFDHIDWQYVEAPPGSNLEKTELWPGEPDEDVMICVYKGHYINQLFHRQDFFFFNFAYQGDYGALSYHFDNRIIVREGECYIGQPGAGYAPNGKSEQEIIIIGVLIQKEAFFKTFFHALSADRKMFRFFLNPQMDESSDEYIHLKFDDEYTIRCLLELMVIEYGNKTDDTQQILKPLVLSLFMQIARQYAASQHTENKDHDMEETPCEKIVKYISEHYDTVTLSDVAAKFSYHPNYISYLLRKETGKNSPKSCWSSGWNVPPGCFLQRSCLWKKLPICWATATPAIFIKHSVDITTLLQGNTSSIILRNAIFLLKI